MYDPGKIRESIEQDGFAIVPDIVSHERIEALIAETAADELSVFTMIYDLDARRRSFEIVAEARDDGVVL